MTETAWYAAEDPRKSVREVVVEVTQPRPVRVQFRQIDAGRELPHPHGKLLGYRSVSAGA